jgi:hypothetical protein
LTSRRFVIGTPYGGLGDHLFLSSLPEIIKSNHPDAVVYLSSQSKFRDNQLQEIIWNSNPFLDGTVDEPYEDLFCRAEAGKAENQEFVIKSIVRSLNLKHSNSDILPKIYNLNRFKSELPELSPEKILADFNYISYVGAITNRSLREIIEKYPPSDIILVNPRRSLRRAFPDLDCIATKSLHEYTSVLARAQKFVCLPSGGAMLALALGLKADVYYGYGHSSIHRHAANNNQAITSANLRNKVISHFLKAKNRMRIVLSNNK